MTNPSSDTPRLCCDCSYMDHEWSGGEGWDVLLCEKRHFNGTVSVAFIRDNIRRAATCPDFTTEPVERPVMTCSVPYMAVLSYLEGK